MKKNKEELKSEIKKYYKSYREGTSPIERKNSFRKFFENVQLWYNDYCYIPKEQKPEVKELGVELFGALDRLVNIEKEPEKFFPYLNTVLKTAVAEYYIQITLLRGGIKTSEAITEKIYKINKDIKEVEKRKDVTYNDRALICISNNMDIQEYERIKKIQAVGRINYRSKNTGDEIDLLNTYNTEENKDFNNHEQNFINGLDVKLVCENIKVILDKIKTTEKRECCRSLFTLYCIENDWLCQELLPLLDSHILDSSSLDKSERPTQTEIYMEYDRDVKKKNGKKIVSKDSAVSRASKMINEFISSLIDMSQKNNP